MMVEVKYDRAVPHPITLDELKKEPRLKNMVLLQKGSRLSVQPVTADEWDIILKMAKG
jgi:predicted RNA-binding protein with PUA-like domain